MLKHVIDKRIILQYLDGGFPIIIKSKTIDDKDVDGMIYKKNIAYLNNTQTITIELLNVLCNENLAVRKLVYYIANNLVYGTNALRLVGKEICESTGLNAVQVSVAIKRLKELNVIKKATDSEIYEGMDIDKKLYIVNHNFLYKGNIKNLKEEILKQRKHESKD